MNDTQPQPRGRLALIEPAYAYSEYSFVVLEATADAYFGRARSISDALSGSATIAEFLTKLDDQDRRTIEEHLEEADVSEFDADLDDEAVWTALYQGDGKGDVVSDSGALGSLLPYEPGMCLGDLLRLDDALLADDDFLEAVHLWDDGAYVVDEELLRRTLAGFGYELIDRRDEWRKT